MRDGGSFAAARDADGPDRQTCIPNAERPFDCTPSSKAAGSARRGAVFCGCDQPGTECVAWWQSDVRRSGSNTSGCVDSPTDARCAALVHR
jgi:hypothetical protein